MPEDPMWDDFATALVRIAFETGPMVLAPAEFGDVGRFPFEAPVHVVTAYNPAGMESDPAANDRRHNELGVAIGGYVWASTMGSAPDGSMAEPGYAVLGLKLEQAIELGRGFGQRAIYRWSPDELTIVGVDEPVRRRLGWSLSDA